MLNAFTPSRSCLTGYSIAAASGFAHIVLLGASTKLYEFDRVVRFGCKIAVTDNAVAIGRRFYDYWAFILPGHVERLSL
jgi:hypothetical protein